MVSGTQYTFPCTIPSAGGDEETVAAGDFYCVSDATNNVVIIPGSAAAIPAGLTCKGVVFHILDDDFNAFKEMNDLDGETLDGYKNKHGLVVSLKKGQVFGSGDVNAIEAALQAIDSDNYTSMDVSNGYKATQGLLAPSEGVSFTALANHKESIPNATSWYAPSFNELKYLIKGEDAASEEASTSGQERINKSLKKIGADELSGAIPSVTFYNGTGDHGLCLMEAGTEKDWHGVPGEVFYPICAF